MQKSTGLSGGYQAFDRFYESHQSEFTRYDGLNTLNIEMIWPGVLQQELKPDQKMIILIKDTTKSQLQNLIDSINKQIELHKSQSKTIVEIFEWSYIESSVFGGFGDEEEDEEMFVFMAIEYMPHSIQKLLDQPEQLQNLMPNDLFAQLVMLSEQEQQIEPITRQDLDTQYIMYQPGQLIDDKQNFMTLDRYEAEVQTLQLQENLKGEKLQRVSEIMQKGQQLGSYKTGSEQVKFQMNENGQKMVQVWDQQSQAYVLKPMQSTVNVHGQQIDQYGQPLDQILDPAQRAQQLKSYNAGSEKMSFQETGNGQKMVQVWDQQSQAYVLKPMQNILNVHGQQIDQYGQPLDQILDPAVRAKNLGSYNADPQQMGFQQDQNGQNMVKVWDPQTQAYILQPIQSNVKVNGFQTDKSGQPLNRVLDVAQKDQQLGSYNANSQQVGFQENQNGQNMVKVWDPQSKAYVLQPYQSSVNTNGQLMDKNGQPLIQINDQSQNGQQLESYNAGSEKMSFQETGNGQQMIKIWDQQSQSYVLKPVQSTVNVHGQYTDQYGQPLDQILDAAQRVQQLGSYNAGNQQMGFQENQNGQNMVKVWDPQTQAYILQPIQSNVKVHGQQTDQYGQPLDQILDPAQRAQQLKSHNAGPQQMGFQENQNGQSMMKVWDHQSQAFVLQPVQSNVNVVDQQKHKFGQPMNPQYDSSQDNHKLGSYRGEPQQIGFEKNQIQKESLMMIDDFEDIDDQKITQLSGPKNHLSQLDPKVGVKLKLASNDENDNTKALQHHEASIDFNRLNEEGQNLKQFSIDNAKNSSNNQGRRFNQNPQVLSQSFERTRLLNPINDEEFNNKNLNRLQGRVDQMDTAKDQNGQNLKKISDLVSDQNILKNKNNTKRQMNTDSEGEQLIRVDDDVDLPKPQSLIRFDQFGSSILEKQGSQLQKLEDISDNNQGLNKVLPKLIINNHENHIYGQQLTSIKDNDQQNQINKVLPDKSMTTIDNLQGVNLIPIQDYGDDPVKNQTSRIEANLVLLKPPRHGKLNKIVALNDIPNNFSKQDEPCGLPFFNSNQNLDLEPFNDQFNKLNNLNSVKPIKLNVNHRRGSRDSVSISIARIFPNDDRQNSSPNRNNNPIYEFEVWSTNKIIFKYQHFMVDRQIQTPSYPSEYTDLVDYNRCKDYKDSQFEKIKYAGFTKDGLLHGKGILMRYPTGAIYDGLWDKGLFVWGLVLELNPKDNLTRYVGPYNEEYQRKHGIGRLEWYELSRGNFKLLEHHQGSFVLGQIRDYGKRTYQNQDVYEGDWKNNVREGFGKLFYKENDERYEGQFVNGKFCGQGTYFHKDNLSEVGEYRDGKSFGEHKVYDQQQQLIKTVNYGKKVK